MVMTILEAEVQEKNVSVLVTSYKEAIQQLEPGMVMSYLVQDSKNRAIWRIITLWESKEVLEKMRSQGTPKGVILFRQAGAEPTLSIYEVSAHS